MEEKPKLIAKYRLNNRQYIAELSNCLAIVTTDEKGEIIRVATFGERRKEDAVK